MSKVRDLQERLARAEARREKSGKTVENLNARIERAQEKCKHQWGSTHHHVEPETIHVPAWDNGECGANHRWEEGRDVTTEFDCWERTCLLCGCVDKKRRKKVRAPEVTPPFPED